MVSEIRKYIIEKVEPEVQIRQYIELMHSLLKRLLAEVSSHKLDSEAKAFLDAKLKETIFGKVDYNNPSKRKDLIRQVGVSVKEGFLPPDKDNREKSIYSLEEGDPSLISTGLDVAKLPYLDGALGRIRQILSNKYTLAAASLLIVLSFAAVWAKNIIAARKLNTEIRNIISSDINPIIYKIAVGIINQKITSESKIEDLISDLNEAIVKKYFIKRSW